MQQPGPMFSVMPSFSPTNITTDQIQKYLEENKKLIVAILDNQNLGKLAECAQYQAQLQKNLMYLAAVADAQPQTPATPPQHMQMAPHPAMQQGGFYMQHPQAAAMGQQPGLFPQRPPFNSPHPMQDSRLHPQASQAQMAPRPIGPTNGIHQTHNDTNLGGNKREKTDGGAAAGSDGHGNSGVTHGGGVGEEAK